MLRIVVCRMYDTHELKIVGKIMRGIRVEWSGEEGWWNHKANNFGQKNTKE